jgi:hypothetical protein
MGKKDWRNESKKYEYAEEKEKYRKKERRNEIS